MSNILNFFNINTWLSNYDSIIMDHEIDNSKVFKYINLLKIIKKYKKICSIIPIGRSIENRKIFKIKWGTGSYKIFIWSQMHGNETTGTKAMFDMLHFFLKQKNTDLVKFLEQKVNIVFIPMLNPDGAETFKRRNSINIDLNRDALRLQSPEIKVLFNEIKINQPNILFNLHDQKSIYNIGDKMFNPSIISFLSPSIGKEQSIHINLERKKAMGFISLIAKTISKFLPKIGSIGRYSDQIYPTSVGDNLQKLGKSCILFEAGNYPGDFKKTIIRKYNALSILIGLYILSTTKNMEQEYYDYFSISENTIKLMDKIYRQIVVKKNSQKFILDIGINYIDKYNGVTNDLDVIQKVIDIGDLSNFFAYQDILCKGQSIYNKQGQNFFPNKGEIEFFNIY
ncbi:M14 family zinc carboxypeptidase [Blattabacterium cuenoti]|uniref:M14 family zinc carboxypeptidase n=1 Tax=Blattabacterium cuenoti TaxID=1653831 RepID=UPI001EEA64E9|nr:M14 family zinc carboxypeptidase [Blattabacterium cuenoti]